jgi:hypothetical protein
MKPLPSQVKVEDKAFAVVKDQPALDPMDLAVVKACKDEGMVRRNMTSDTMPIKLFFNTC